MMMIKTLLIFALSAPGFSAVLKHDVSAAKQVEYTFREVCETLGSKNLELISAKSVSEIECMNKTYKAIDFCLNKFPLDKTLTRGIVDEKSKKVICESSPSIMLAISCDARDLKYCFDPKKGCDELGKIYAHRLEVVHYSMLEKNINCYFSKPVDDSFNEIEKPR